VLILIVTLTITAILQFNRRQQILLSQKGLQLQVDKNTKSIVYKVLNKPNFEIKNGTTSLFGNDTTFYSIEPWGLFLRVNAKSGIKNAHSRRSFLVGKKADSQFGSALLLGNKQNPLILTGSTLIDGDVIVGLNGVRPGVLKGKRFTGQSLVMGNIIREAKSGLPYFDPKIETINKNIIGNLKETDNKIYLKNDRYSFNRQKLMELQRTGIEHIIGPGLLEIDGNITFENLSLLNQVEVVSDSNITFGTGSVSEQILVKANGILIENNSLHRGQFIAKNWLKTQNASFKYPSVLAVINNDDIVRKRYLEIGANVVIDGSVILSTKISNQAQPEKIYIDASSQVNGFVYSNQYCEIQGEIRGTIMTQNFYLYSSPTTYINWLNGATISRPAFEGTFCIPVGLKNDVGFTILSEL
jgi:hypothetical protein